MSYTCFYKPGWPQHWSDDAWKPWIFDVVVLNGVWFNNVNVAISLNINNFFFHSITLHCLCWRYPESFTNIYGRLVYNHYLQKIAADGVSVQIRDFQTRTNTRLSNASLCIVTTHAVFWIHCFLLKEVFMGCYLLKIASNICYLQTIVKA